MFQFQSATTFDLLSLYLDASSTNALFVKLPTKSRAAFRNRGGQWTYNRLPFFLPGAVIVDGMIFVNSGYTRFRGMPGNVLLAIRRK